MLKDALIIFGFVVAVFTLIIGTLYFYTTNPKENEKDYELQEENN